MSHVLDALAEPLAITRQGLYVVLAIASRDEFFRDVREQALAARDGKPLANTRNVELRDGGVAVIPVHGPLMRHAGFFAKISGATSYDALRKDLTQAVENQAVRAIVLEFDSPGGELNGVAAMAKAIRDVRGIKPIKAFASNYCASAAYWLASSCDEIITGPTGQLGSIGVVQSVIRPDEKGGRTIDIYSSQSPNKKMDIGDDGDRARLQKRIDDLAEVFVEAVAANRGVPAATVLEKFGAGDVLVGKHAVAVGLADRVGDFEDVLAEFASQSATGLVTITAAKAIAIT